MPEVVGGSIGPEASYDIAFTAGSLNIGVKYGGQQSSASVAVSVSAAMLVDALAQKVSSPEGKALLLGLEAIIKSIP